MGSALSLRLAFALLALMAAPWAAVAGEGAYDLDGGREATIAGAGAALGAAALRLDASGAPLTPEEIEHLDAARVPGLDRGATRRWSPVASSLSDGIFAALGAAPLALAIAGDGRHEPAEPLAMYAETIVVTYGSVALLKAAFPRARPFVYNADPGVPVAEKLDGSARRSFPSGHAAGSFAAAVFLGTVFSELHPDSDARPIVWGAALTGAALTSWLRVRSGRHFPTDVLAGAAVGAAVGYFVPRLHEADAGDASGGATPLLLRVGVTF